MSVINAKEEFEHKQFQNKFLTLLDIFEKHQEDIIKNPLPYLKQAHDEIIRVRMILEEITEATYVNNALWRSDEDILESIRCEYKTITIPKEDYEKYQKVMDIVSKVNSKLYVSEGSNNG